ncbi:MAG: hypothetical protein HQK49_17605 [Oligoflexia bacterium]|nr:hypothetical protein [Oligoflexia bacterium]
MCLKINSRALISFSLSLRVLILISIFATASIGYITTIKAEDLCLDAQHGFNEAYKQVKDYLLDAPNIDIPNLKKIRRNCANLAPEDATYINDLLDGFLANEYKVYNVFAEKVIGITTNCPSYVLLQYTDQIKEVVKKIIVERIIFAFKSVVDLYSNNSEYFDAITRITERIYDDVKASPVSTYYPQDYANYINVIKGSYFLLGKDFIQRIRNQHDYNLIPSIKIFTNVYLSNPDFFTQAQAKELLSLVSKAMKFEVSIEGMNSGTVVVDNAYTRSLGIIKIGMENGNDYSRLRGKGKIKISDGSSTSVCSTPNEVKTCTSSLAQKQAFDYNVIQADFDNACENKNLKIVVPAAFGSPDEKWHLCYTNVTYMCLPNNGLRLGNNPITATIHGNVFRRSNYFDSTYGAYIFNLNYQNNTPNVVATESFTVTSPDGTDQKSSLTFTITHKPE